MALRPELETVDWPGRPEIDATGMPNVYLAGDWVGRYGVLSDAAFASGHTAGRNAARVIDHSRTQLT